MILVCPSCASTHHIARQLLGAKGRQVRCAQCRSVWFQAPPDEMPALDPMPLIAVEAQSAGHDDWLQVHGPANENEPRPVQIRQRGRWRPLWAVALVGAIAASAMAAVAQREAIVRLVPAVQGAYAAIGLPINVRGLDLRTIKSTLMADGTGHVIAVTGEIANLRGETAQVPGVRVALRGSDGREVYNWTAPPPKAKLAAGETVVFRTRLADPPSGARDVVVQFADVTSADARQDARRTDAR